MFDFWRMCLACWFMLFAIYVSFSFQDFHFCCATDSSVLVSGVLFRSCDKAFFPLMFVCNYHFATWLSDFIRKK